MKKKNLGFGIFIIFIGVIWLLINFDFLDWTIFTSLYTLWPLIFVVIGINIIARHNQWIKLIVWVLFFLVIIGYSILNNSNYNYGDQFSDNTSNYLISSTIDIDKNSETEKANLNLDIGAVDLRIFGGSEKLIEGKISGFEAISNDFQEGINQVVEIKQESRIFDVGDIFDKKIFTAKFEIDDTVPWDIDLDVGAANAILDLKSVPVENMNIDLGASNLEIYLGKKSQEVHIDIDAGASNIELNLPEDVGLMVNVEGGLKEVDFNGFSLSSDSDKKHYVTENWDEAKTKVYVDTSLGVGNIDFRTY